MAGTNLEAGASIYPDGTPCLIHTSHLLSPQHRLGALVTLTSHQLEFLIASDPIMSSQQPGFTVLLN
jgi:hypothetical protein